MRYFRVVVIDDDEEVIRQLRGRLSRSERAFEGETWRLDLATVLVGTEPDGSGGRRFTASTMTELTQAFSVPRDLIFFDYGFMEPGLVDSGLKQIEEGGAIEAGDFRGRYLTPVDLLAAVAAVDERTPGTAALKANLLEFTGKVYLYTMTLEVFLAEFGEPEARRAKLAAAFKGPPRVHLIDTYYEIYNRRLPGKRHERHFYAHQVGGLIDRHIQIALLEAMLEDARRLKYLQYPRSAGAALVIVAIGSAIAAVAALVGNNVGDLLRARAYGQALFAAGFGVMFALVTGLLLPLLFGRIMSGLLGLSRRRDDG